VQTIGLMGNLKTSIKLVLLILQGRLVDLLSYLKSGPLFLKELYLRFSVIGL